MCMGSFCICLSSNLYLVEDDRIERADQSHLTSINLTHRESLALGKKPILQVQLQQEAVKVVKVYEQEYICDPVKFLALLKACVIQRDLKGGSKIHADIIENGLERNIFVGSALVNLYAKCGALAEAEETFCELPFRDIVPWNAIILGHVQHGQSDKALHFYEQMQRDGITPNALTFSCLLKACGSIKAAEKGQEIHAQIPREEVLEKNVVVANALVGMYAKCGMLEKAREVFDSLPVRNVVSWNTLIAAYSQHGYGKEALHFYEQMHCHGFSPDAVTFVCLLKACGTIGASDKGQEIHFQITKDGLLEEDTIVGVALVDMYSKFGLLDKAREVFNKQPVWNVVAWNALIAGYTQHKRDEEALNCYRHMREDGASPDAFTFTCILKACGSLGASDIGKEIHNEIIREGLLEENVAVGNALVDMYVRCGLLGKAQEVFNKMPIQDVVSWNVLIAGYVHHGYHNKAVGCFKKMLSQGCSPDEVTLSYILKACGCIGAVQKGEEIHAQMVRQGQVGHVPLVDSAVIDIYANCGMLLEAEHVFNRLLFPDIVSWNILMAGYAQIGNEDKIFGKLMEMVKAGVKPNAATFTIVLKTCSHSGLLDACEACFQMMSSDYSIISSLEHYTCIVDLNGRTGHLHKVVTIITEMPYFSDFTLWQSVLNSCRLCGDRELLKIAFEHVGKADATEQWVV